MTILVKQATKKDDHQALVKIAKQSKFTKDFSNAVMFSSEAAYEKGWIRKAVITGTTEIVGFTCVRHCMPRRGETVLYFITVHELIRSHQVGEILMDDLELQTPHKRIVLNVAKDNPRAVAFYERLGYAIVNGNAIKGTAFHMALEME